MNQVADIKSYAKRNDVPIMKDEGIDFICDYIKNHECKKILEIGSAIGYSAIKFAQVSPEIHVTTIEIDIDRYSQAVQNILDCGLKDRITIHCADALTFPIEGKFDLVFIDAAKAQYIKFFQKYKNYLTENGVIISDNLAFHGMVENPEMTHNYSTIKLLRKIRKYVAFLKSNPEFKTDFFQTGDGISVSRASNNIPNIHFEKQKNEAVIYQLYRGCQYYFVKDEHGEVLGCIAFYKRDDELYLDRFYLRDEERGKGYSRQMLRFAVEQAEKRRLHKITMKVNKNSSPIEALEKIGFTKKCVKASETKTEASDITMEFIL